MTEAPIVWRERLVVRAWEVGPEGEAGLPALCNWLQDAAGNHASALAWGMEELAEQDLTWVLARLHLRVTRLPSWRQEVEVATWPCGLHRALAVRDFSVGSNGSTLALATSGWVLVDTTTGRPVRPKAGLLAIAAQAPPRALEDAFERLPELSEPAARVEVRVGRSDLDLNGHANNVRFVAWALDSLPGEAVSGMDPLDMELELRAEAREGDLLCVEVAPADPGRGSWLHRILRPGDGRELARARSAWVGRTAPGDGRGAPARGAASR